MLIKKTACSNNAICTCTTSCYLEKSRDPNFLNLKKRLREKYSCLLSVLDDHMEKLSRNAQKLYLRNG